MKNVRRAMLAALVVGVMALAPQSASAQGLWVGSWGWGGPVAFGPAPAFYGFGPSYVSTYRSVGWGYPGFYGPAYAAPVYRPVYGYGGPVVVAPRARAIRVGNRVARRNWRWGYGWGW